MERRKFTREFKLKGTSKNVLLMRDRAQVRIES